MRASLRVINSTGPVGRGNFNCTQPIVWTRELTLTDKADVSGLAFINQQDYNQNRFLYFVNSRFHLKVANLTKDQSNNATMEWLAEFDLKLPLSPQTHECIF